MKRISILLLLIFPLLIQAQTGCSDPLAINYYCNTDAGNPELNPTTGCQFTGVDPVTFAPIFSLPIGFVDDGSCYYNPGCTDSQYLEYDSAADEDDGSCETIMVLGCTNPNACNYNSAANVEDSSL